MCETITYFEIKNELLRRFPASEAGEIEKYAAAFVDFTSGKYVCGKQIVKYKRNKELRSLFTGHNLDELAKKHNLSPRHIRRLIEKK